MTGTTRLVEQIEVVLRDRLSNQYHHLFVDVIDNYLSRKWLAALVNVVDKNLHLEKNYCFLGFADSIRNGKYLCDRMNESVKAINDAELGYEISDWFQLDQLLVPGPVGDDLPGGKVNHDRLNRLHRYFEDLQGVSHAISAFYTKADPTVRWHIRQLNLLCHEFESWALSWRKKQHAPEWMRPSQLMCWLQAPRFELTDKDFDLFGIESLHRDQGGVYVGVNKAVGKHHWEVFRDEGRDSRLDELTTTTLRSQTEAAADFDIEWGKGTKGHPWMTDELEDFRTWLVSNGFDPEDPALTIGHPKVAQIDMHRSFGNGDIWRIWKTLYKHLDVYSVSVAGVRAIYDYHWSDDNYMHTQITALGGH